MGLFGCTALLAVPSVVAQPQDRDTECAAITAEIEGNKTKLAELEKGGFFESKNSDYVAAATGGVGAVLLLGYYGLVHKPSVEKEIAALQQRQQYLATLAEQRCAPPPAPQAKAAKKTKRR